MPAFFYCIPVHITHNHPGKVFAWTDCGVQHICQTIGARKSNSWFPQSCHITAQISKHPQFGGLSVIYSLYQSSHREVSGHPVWVYLYSLSRAHWSMFSAGQTRRSPAVSRLQSFESCSNGNAGHGWTGYPDVLAPLRRFTWYPVSPETLSININMNVNAFFNNFIKISCNIKSGSTVSFIFPQDNDTMKPFYKKTNLSFISHKEQRHCSRTWVSADGGSYLIHDNRVDLVFSFTFSAT